MQRSFVGSGGLAFNVCNEGSKAVFVALLRMRSLPYTHISTEGIYGDSGA